MMGVQVGAQDKCPNPSPTQESELEQEADYAKGRILQKQLHSRFQCCLYPFPRGGCIIGKQKQKDYLH